MDFANALESIKNAVQDLSTLSVKTYSGNITATVDGAIDDWDALLETAKTSGDVSLKLSTDVKIDGDSNIFVADGVSEDLATIHGNAVESARKTRESIVNLVIGITKKLGG